jgi:hypothetical protein
VAIQRTSIASDLTAAFACGPQPLVLNAFQAAYYKATLGGEEIVSRSSDPAFAACRAMKARGLSGRVESTGRASRIQN